MGTDDQLEQLEVRLGDIHAELTKEAKKRDTRIRTNRILTVLCLAGLIVGGFYARSAHEDLSAQNARTDKARIASCNQSNDAQINQRHAERIEIRKLLDALVQAASDPGLAEMRAETFLNGARKDGSDGYYATIDMAHPLRDCTPEGIARYLNIARSENPS